jgi:hypothetical protein
MRVLEAEPAQRVLWQVADGPDAWIGTKVHWQLRPETEGTTILFKHEGWKEPSEFMHHCSSKWGTFLMSLKSLIETGKGSPFPDDVRVSVDAD